jgi:hypothetical protein
MAKNRGNRPTPSREKLAEPVEPPDYNDQTPKFCLNFLRDGFDVHALPMAGVRVRDVYHVLWLEPEFGRLYDHGTS